MKRGAGQRRLEIALDGAHREGILVAGFVIGHGSTVDVHAERVGLRTEAGSADLGRAGVVGDVRAEVSVGEAKADARNDEERRKRLRERQSVHGCRSRVSAR